MVTLFNIVLILCATVQLLCVSYLVFISLQYKVMEKDMKKKITGTKPEIVNPSKPERPMGYFQGYMSSRETGKSLKKPENS